METREGLWHGASPSEGRMCSLGGGVKSGRMGSAVMSSHARSDG